MLAVCPRPLASLQLFQRMMHDIMTGGQTSDPIDQVRACFLFCLRGRVHVRCSSCLSSKPMLQLLLLICRAFSHVMAFSCHALL